MSAPNRLTTAPSYAGPWSSLPSHAVLTPWLSTHLTSTLSLSQMTPVQSTTIPQFLSHRDVIVEAVTGSGKTLAFLVPVLEMLCRRGGKLGKRQVGAIIITPTRELAAQIKEILDGFLKAQTERTEDETEEEEHLPPHIHIDKADSDDEVDPLKPFLGSQISCAQLLVGGDKDGPAQDRRFFKEYGPDILVGTPGRLDELLKRENVVDTKELEVLVMDEADRLLDLGFAPTLHSILSHLPKQRRTGLFSATMTDALSELAGVGLRNPVRIVVKVEEKSNASNAKGKGKGKGKEEDSRRTPATLQNFYLACKPENKVAQLVRLLRFETPGAKSRDGNGRLGMKKAIVYFATCAQVNYFQKLLSSAPEVLQSGLKLYSLHGKQTPSKRKATFTSFVSAVPLGYNSDAPPLRCSGSKGTGKSKSKSPSSSSQEGIEQASILLCTDVAARGLDLPDVDLVVQFDPPNDPKVFSHRCGRTARAGRSGRAVVLLNKGKEEELVDFMQVRKIPLRAYPYLLQQNETSDEDGEERPKVKGRQLLPLPKPGLEPSPDASSETFRLTLRNLVSCDRELHELSLRAFVSFLRSYDAHEAAYIFRSKDLDLGGIARGWGMLRMPTMPEVRERRKMGIKEGKSEREIWGFEEMEVDMRTFAYADKLREKQRLESQALSDAKASAEAAAAAATAGEDLDATSRDAQSSRPSLPLSTSRSQSQKKRMRGSEASESAWSDQKSRKARKEVRREKKVRKRVYLKGLRREEEGEGEGDGKAKAKAKMVGREKEEEEEDDWAKEEKEVKKARKSDGGAAVRGAHKEGDTTTRTAKGEDEDFFDGF